MGKITLTRIEIEGFRGVNKEITLDFNEKCTTIFAPNGMGKTSILGAIEWCLFSDLKYQEKENATSDELVNINQRAGRARVRMTLRDGDGSYIVERERGIRKKASELSITLPDNNRIIGDEAEGFIFRFTGLTFDDFYRAVFLHQESVRGLLTEEPRMRNEALDRLFGLDKIRSILKSIPMKATADALGKLEEKKSQLTERMSGASEQIEHERTNKLNDAIDVGYQEKDLTIGTAKQELMPVISKLNSMSKSCGLAELDMPITDEVQEIDKTIKKMKSRMKEVRMKGTMNLEKDGLIQRQLTIDQLKAKFDEAIEHEANSKSKLDEFIAKNGSNDDLAFHIDELTKQMRNLQLKLENKNLQHRLLIDAIDYLKTMPNSKECPVCGDAKDTKILIGDLQNRVVGPFKKEIDEINESIRGTETRKETILSNQRELLLLAKDKESASTRLKSIISEIKAKYKGPSNINDPATILHNAKDGIEKEMETLTKSSTLKEIDLADWESTIERVNKISAFLKSESEFKRLREKIGEEESGGFQKELDELLALQRSLESIIRALNSVATQQADNLIAQSHDEISRYYGLLCNHPLFDNIRIEMGAKKSKMVEKNSYSIHAFSTKGGQKTLASSRLSTAQMNCVALSLYLALSKTLPHNLGFIILDDPSQNLDREHKESLSKLLLEIMGNVQLIIASHDTEVQTTLENSLDKDDSSGYSLAWSPLEGTKVNTLW